MKKFVVLTYGFTPPTEEVQLAWGAWFAAPGPNSLTRAVHSGGV